MASVAETSEINFRAWLKRQVMEDGQRKYSDNEVSVYAYTLKTACSQMDQAVAGNLFFLTQMDSRNGKFMDLMQHPDFEAVDKALHGSLSASIKLYQFFLENGQLSEAPDVHSAFYLGDSAVESTKDEVKSAGFYYEEIPMECIQKVFYGAPGTGKSYSVSKLMEQYYPDVEEMHRHSKRVIFHPTYSYGEFVGAIKPLISLDRPLDYLFVAGPFTELLKMAFLYPEERFFLIIEEINRGDAPSIFGDIFQLLDRDDKGKSRYVIVNRDIGAYFSRDPWMKNLFFDGRLWLPANFNIIATMNTADDNIFVMDSAFKRRFTLEYVPIDFSILPNTMSRQRSIFYGKKGLAELFAPKEGETNNVRRAVCKKAMELAEKDQLNRNWPTFARLANAAIDAENLECKKAGISYDRLIAENKKMGPFFLHEGELETRNLFLNKVVFYLKQDVFKDSANYMLESYEEIFEKYMSEEADMFELLL